MTDLDKKIEDLEERILKLEEIVITQRAQLAALDYLTLPKDKVGKVVDDIQDRMYRISKEITDKLKPKD